MDFSRDEVGDTKMKLLWNKNNITGYVTSVAWAGSAKQAARSVVFNVVYSPNDKDVKTLGIKLGDKITFYPGYPDDKKTVFVGTVTTRERKSEAGELSYTAQDGMTHLLRSSQSYRFCNCTPEKIVSMVCKDVKVPVGTLAKTKMDIPRIFFQERPYYEIIMTAYTKAHKKNKKEYIAQMNGAKLEVVEKGEIIPNFHIAQGERILESSYTETLDNMVNRVYVYNSNNQKIGVMTHTGWTGKYGIFQAAITVDSGNGKTEAKNELHGIDKTASLSAIGDVRCVAGKGVIIKDSRTGLNGKYWIENDTHTWENGTYTMQLELAFKNVMDTQEEDEEQSATSTGNSITSGSSNSEALKEVVNEARRWLGTGENPPGSNHNAITEYYGEGDLQWCCAFMWAIFNRTGHGNLFMGGGKTAYCFDVMNWYKARGKFDNSPRVGDMIIYGGSGHIGIVIEVHGNSYKTVEGNLSDMVKISNGPSCSTVLGFCHPDWPITKAGSEVGNAKAYALSDTQLQGLARLCQQEQGTVKGAMAEASLMANLFEKKGSNYGIGANGLYNYVKNGGWFAQASYWMSQTGSLDGNILEGVRKVLVNGSRTLPTYVDEHDCFSDIYSAVNNGSGINVHDRSQYRQDITKIRNKYSSSYTFYCFPDSNSDPFGYTGK